MFFEEIRTKQELSYISVCSLSILYSSKFILMATSLVTNAIVVKRVHCTCKSGLHASVVDTYCTAVLFAALLYLFMIFSCTDGLIRLYCGQYM